MGSGNAYLQSDVPVAASNVVDYATSLSVSRKRHPNTTASNDPEYRNFMVIPGYRPENEYRKAIKLNPDNADYHNGLGSALLGQNKIIDAIAEFRKAIKFDRMSRPRYWQRPLFPEQVR